MSAIFFLLFQKRKVDRPQIRAETATVLSFTDSPHIQARRRTMMERNQMKKRIIFRDPKKKDCSPDIPSISIVFTYMG
jgi:hypothetical protein